MYTCVSVLSCFSCVLIFGTLWTVAHQVPLSIGLSRQGYCSGLTCSPPGDLCHQWIEPESLMSFTLTGGFFTASATWEAPVYTGYLKNQDALDRLYKGKHISQKYKKCLSKRRDFPGGSNGKVSVRNEGGPSLIPGLGRSPGEENGSPLQYSCLENSMD